MSLDRADAVETLARRVDILLVEDDPIDAELVAARLEEGGLSFSLTRVSDEAAFAAALHERSPDIVLSDYNVPGFDGGAALALCRRVRPQTPFIFVSGALGEDKAVDLLKRGATDYILKDRLERLPSSVERALREARERAELLRIEAERERGRWRLEILATASHLLASSFDCATTVAAVLRSVVPALGDMGFFDLRRRDGSVLRVLPDGPDDRWAGLLGGTGLCAATTGAPVLRASLDDDEARALCPADQLAALAALGVRSVMSVPLHYHDRLLGALTLLGGPTHRYTTADLAFAGELGLRAAAAIENAELYQAQVEARREVEALATELQKKEERARAMLAALAEGIALQDASGRLLQLNASAEQMLGVTVGAPVVWDVVSESGAPLPQAEFPSNRALRTGLPQLGCILGLRRPGAPERWLHVNAQPMYGPDGTTLEGVISSFFDVSDRKRAEAEQRERAEFEQQLIGIVSHDLRNPIAAMMMGAQVLVRQEDLGANHHRLVARILSSGERATRLISDLLDFTQARLGGGIRVSPVQADLHEVVRQAVEEIHFTWPDREILLDEVGDGRGTWDPDRLSQVVTNLVTNALRYSPGGTPVRVSARAAGDGHVELRVHNEGPPIRPDFVEHLFDPLQRGTNEVDRHGRSVGLGLFIVKRIVDAHRGTVAVRSLEGEGTTFTVTLPRAPAR